MREFSILRNKSYRQCQRIVAKVRLNGMLGIKHGNSGKPARNRLPDLLLQSIRHLIKTKYYDFNLTHLREKLFEVENISITRESLRRLAYTIGVPKKAQTRRRKKVYCLRPRMPREGMLVQFDGSEHPWFTETGMLATLIGGIDDATGKILGLEFCSGEDTFNC